MISKLPGLKIMFMGTPETAAKMLSDLASAGFAFESVVTRPDKPHGRKHDLIPSPVSEEAKKLGIPCFKPGSKIELEEMVKELKPDLILVVAFGMIIPQSVIDIPKHGIINTHFSLLPKYRGAAPYVASIINGDIETGTTIMKMSLGLDEGDIIAQNKIALNGTETAPELLESLANLSTKLLERVLPEWIAGGIKATPQEGEVSYFNMLKKEDGKLNWQVQSAEEIERMSRAFVPWPGTYAYWDNKKIDLYEIEVSDIKIAPGEVQANEHGLLIGARQGSIKIGALKLEGKSELPAEIFLRGHADFLGTKLN